MNIDTITQILNIIAGGSFVALLTLILNQGNKIKDDRVKKIDDRIAAWQEISRENERRLEHIEQHLKQCAQHITHMQKYANKLEQTLAKHAPDVEIPERPSIGEIEISKNFSENA